MQNNLRAGAGGAGCGGAGTGGGAGGTSGGDGAGGGANYCKMHKHFFIKYHL